MFSRWIGLAVFSYPLGKGHLGSKLECLSVGMVAPFWVEWDLAACTAACTGSDGQSQATSLRNRLAFFLASHDRDVLFHGNHNRVGGVGGKHRAVQAQCDMGMIRLGKSNEFFGANFMDIGIISLQDTRIATKLELK